MKQHDVFYIIQISGMPETKGSASQPAQMGMSSMTIYHQLCQKKIHDMQNITSPPPVTSKIEYKSVS
jgi:hypothetical protein